MPTRTPLRVAFPRPARIVCVTTLLLAGAVAAQPPRPGPPPVDRVPAPPPPAPGDPDSLSRPDFSGVWVLNAKESDDPRPIFATMMPTGKPAGGKQGKPGGRPGIGVRGGNDGSGGMGGGGMGGGGMGGGGMGGGGMGGGGMGGGGMGGGGMGGGGMGSGAGRGDDVTNGDDQESSGARPTAEAKFGGGADDPAAAKARQAYAARMAAAWQRLLIAQSAEEVEIIDGTEQRRICIPDGQRRPTRAGPFETTRWEAGTMVVTLEQDGRPGLTQTYRLVPSEKRLYVTLRLPGHGPGGAKVIRLVYESA